MSDRIVAPQTKMTDREFAIEVRRGLLIIIRAMIRRFGMSWEEFKPAAVERQVDQLVR